MKQYSHPSALSWHKFHTSLRFHKRLSELRQTLFYKIRGGGEIKYINAIISRITYVYSFRTHCEFANLFTVFPRHNNRRSCRLSALINMPFTRDSAATIYFQHFPHAQILCPITKDSCFHRNLPTHHWSDELQDSERLNKSVYYSSFLPKHVSIRVFRLTFVQSALVIYLLFTSAKAIVLIRTSSGPLLSVRLLRGSRIDIKSNQEETPRF
jgi:hypothetical protein